MRQGGEHNRALNEVAEGPELLGERAEVESAIGDVRGAVLRPVRLGLGGRLEEVPHSQRHLLLPYPLRPDVEDVDAGVGEDHPGVSLPQVGRPDPDGQGAGKLPADLGGV